MPNYSGPYTKPSLGLSLRSLKPVDIFLNNPTGLPMILSDPNILYNCLRTELL